MQKQIVKRSKCKYGIALKDGGGLGRFRTKEQAFQKIGQSKKAVLKNFIDSIELRKLGKRVALKDKQLS